MTQKSSSTKSYYECALRHEGSDHEGLREPAHQDFLRRLKAAPRRTYRRGLDLGYGFGTYSIAMAQHNMSVLAVDQISPKFLRDRLAALCPEYNIEVLQADLRTFRPEGSFDAIVCKDVLHYLPMEAAFDLWNNIVCATRKGGLNYVQIFTDITRSGPGGVREYIPGEANLTTEVATQHISKIYDNWNLDVVVDEYTEKGNRDSTGVYFQARRVRVLALQADSLVEGDLR